MSIVRWIKPILLPVIYVVLSILVGVIVLFVFDWNPLDILSLAYEGVFGSPAALGKVLAASTPIIFTGLAAAVAFKCGLINIGAEGQFLMGALGATLVGRWCFWLPWGTRVLLAVVTGALVGMLWAVIAGALKVYRGVHEVITSIMLNYVAFEIATYAIKTLGITDFEGPRGILVDLRLINLSDIFPSLSGIPITIGFVVAVIACLIMIFIFKKTVFGYELRAVGADRAIAKRAGINISRQVIAAMAISGLLAGLGGTESVLGQYHAFLNGISPTPGHGSIGIVAALLVANNPLGVIFSGMFFGMLSSARTYLTGTGYVPFSIVNIVQIATMCFAVVSYAKSKLGRANTEVDS